MLALTSLFADPLTVFTVGLVLMILFFWYFATELESRKRNVGTVLTVGIVGLCIVAATPPSKKLKGSIDIVGGSSFSLRVQEKENDEGDKIPVTPQQVEQAILVIEKRLNSMGTTEPLIAGQGDNGILVQMPGVSEEESAQVRTTLEKVAKLELREVSLRTDEIGPDGRTLAARVQSGDEIVPGYRAYNHTRKDEDGNEMTSPILLNRRMALGGSDIAMAVPSPQQADAVAITLNSDGTDKMINLTKDMTPRQGRIAIVLDGEVISAPVVNQVPLGKNFIIEGLTEPGEVQSLANSLMNPLENPLVVDEERTVSPLLGKAVIEQGVWAGLVGLSLTFVFVLLYYRSAGIIALLGLLVNGTILFGVMAMFGFAFSLPGIAGMVLIIGMSVDANVLIYERLREEIEHGKSLKNAINSAYEKAFSAIFDSNVTSLITAIILFSLGSGSIKGFAITLTVGLLASMFSAILVTRVLFRWMLDTGLLKKLSFLNLIKSANYDFLAKRRICAFVSLALLVVAFGAFGAKREKAFGIDFTGGSLIEFQLGDVVVPLEDVQNTLNGLKLTKEAYPQEQSNPASGTLLTVRCDAKDTEQITNALREQIPALGKTAEGSDTNYLIDVSKQEVSALIGSSFLSQSLIALIVGMIAILLYVTVRFEFAFAVGAFVAILHDVIISIGIVILLGGELSLIHVGAILTIAGYSVNDTIVVFDRIRETLLVRSGSIMKIMNESINATLSRTILTSATTIATVAILSVFGGSALRDFSVTILIGLIVGTYSSIFVATPIVLWWSSRKGGDIRADVRATEIAAEAAANAP